MFEIMPARLSRPRYWITVLVVFPLFVFAGYLEVVGMTSHQTAMPRVASIFGIWIAASIFSRVRDSGRNGILVALVVIILAALTGMFPALRADWLHANGITRAPLEMMFPDTLAIYALLALIIIVAGTLSPNSARALAACDAEIARNPSAAAYLGNL